MRTLLLNRLQHRGDLVFCADTCSEALAEYEHLYDIITIILMDVGLRDASGFECRRKLLAVNPKARVIFMSGQCDALPPGNGTRYHSCRNLSPSINCAVLGSLAETELFGHVSGAFTGATRNTKGYIGSADGGTLFFDEVGELPIDVQAKLLRFLDDGQYSRVGEAKIQKVDVRVLAATNRNLQEMCRNGTFREDLYFRLSASIIETTPLDERKADILPLIWHFLDLFGTAKNITYEISADAASLLIEKEWPGNVRQLKQTLYKISQMAASRKISLADVRRVIGNQVREIPVTYKQAKEQAMEEFDRDYLLKTLSLAQGSLQQALQLSGMHKKNFYTKIKELGLAMKDFSATRSRR